MPYTYTITKDLICYIKLDDVVVDNPGPWESEAAAQHWAEAYVGQLNLGLEE